MASLSEQSHPKPSMEQRPCPSIELTPVKNDEQTLKNWITWITDPHISQWMTGHIPKTPSEVSEWLYHATHDPRRHYFSIQEDGKAIGIINLRVDHAPYDTGEIGIIIGEAKNRRRGIGKEAVKQILAYAKDAMSLASVRAHIKPANENSIRLFVGQGFTQTGTVTIDGVAFGRYEKSLQNDMRDIIQPMKIEQHGKLYTYFHPFSTQLEKELSFIHEETPAEHKPSVERIIPKLKIIFHGQDTKAAWGQVPVDVSKLVAGLLMIPRIVDSARQVVRPDHQGNPLIGRVMDFLWNVTLTDLIAFIPGPNKFAKYDIAAARPELRAMAANGTLNERSVKALVTPGRK